MMNSLPLDLLWYLILIAVHVAENCDVHPGNEVTFRLIQEGQADLEVTLRKTHSFLANENLPIWTFGNNPVKLIPDKEVMKSLGSFSMYHNSDLSSAAIYYHDRREFHGNIDSRFVINALRIRDVKKRLKVQHETVEQMYAVVPNDLLPGIIKRIWAAHTYRAARSAEFGNLTASIHQGETIDDIIPNSLRPTGRQLLQRNSSCLVDEKERLTNQSQSQSKVRSRRNLPDVVYVKVLVIINYDLAERIKNHEKMGIVPYVLNMFNGVDMLYSKVDEPKIKINLAGIIIGTKEDPFFSMERCYGLDTTFNLRTMDIDCIQPHIERYLHEHSKVISPDSYNIPILLTSYVLRRKSLFGTRNPVGTTHVIDDYYGIKRRGSIEKPLVRLRDMPYFRQFACVAHEIAHGLRVGHDEESSMDNDKNCLRHLMSTTEDFCVDCLSWSLGSRMDLKKFFSSRDRCFFVKKPQSLEKPGPREIWTEDEQCRCYGYESAAISEATWLDRFYRVSVREKCATNLKCKGRYNMFYHNAPIPFDGTLCGENADGVRKVCWNQECKPVQTHEDRE